MKIYEFNVIMQVKRGQDGALQEPVARSKEESGGEAMTAPNIIMSTMYTKPAKKDGKVRLSLKIK